LKFDNMPVNIPLVKALLFMKHHSERVPRKNMRDFNGRPLFHWIVAELGKSRYIEEIIINTDSTEIAENAEKNFKVTIHMRPAYLLEITSNEANQIMAYDLSISAGEHFIQTHSTNPLLTAGTIDRSIEAFFSDGTHDSLFSVTPVQKRFYFCDGRPVNHDPSKLIKTQELAPIFEENSCIYVFSRNSFSHTGNRIGLRPKLFPMDRSESTDIDTMDDFQWAEYLLANRLEKKD
jgi:CMP-N-acetylneuraminic acid synthetase